MCRRRICRCAGPPESSDRTGDAANDARLRDKDVPAKSRIGAIPTYGLPAASGASTSGYDSLNRTKKKTKYYPGQAKPKPPPGPGSKPPQPLPANGRVRLSIPPSDSANKAPIPPAMAGTVVGQPPRKRLKIDDDPFGAIGDYAGSFLIKSAVELRGGFDTNPRRTVEPKGSPFYVIAPEFLAVSEWQRHAVVADLRGSFTGYGNTFPPPTDGTISSAPVVVDRPDFDGHIDGRLDVSRDFRLMGQGRLRVATDNPGSPNIQAGLQRYPVYTTLGGTFGVDQNFNRLQLSAGLTADRTVYQASKLTDGTSSSNDDRNYNQFGGLGRVSYDLIPGLKPFGEIVGNVREHDQQADRTGYLRNSSGGSVRAGTTFEFSRILTGELAVGWAARTYQDPRLMPLQGLADVGLAGVGGDAADHGKVLRHHLDRRDHRARRLRRADQHLHRGSRSRFPPLADRDRQIHLGHPGLSGRRALRPLLFDLRRPDLQAEPQHLAQGHAAPRLARLQHRRQQHQFDGGDAGREVAALSFRHAACGCILSMSVFSG